MRCAIALLAPLLCCASPRLAGAELVPFTAVLEIRASAGTSFESFPLLSLETAGVAEIAAGVVHIPAGELSAIVPGVAGFGGTLFNGAASFQPGGAGVGSSCPLTQVQEVCIEGGGFGGVMKLGGLTQDGQTISVWGSGGTSTGSTASGVQRTVQGRRWTQGNGAVWYYVLEIDPGTPFVLSDAGSFRGPPSTVSGDGLPGFSLVTPVALTSELSTSEKNVRGIARLRIDFARPVPVGGVGILALLLGALGVMRLRHSAQSRSPPRGFADPACGGPRRCRSSSRSASGTASSGSGSSPRYRHVVLDRRKGIVEVMQQLPPALVPG